LNRLYDITWFGAVNGTNIEHIPYNLIFTIKFNASILDINYDYFMGLFEFVVVE